MLPGMTRFSGRGLDMTWIPGRSSNPAWLASQSSRVTRFAGSG